MIDVVRKPKTPQSTLAERSEQPALDRDKVRSAIRRLGDEYAFYILDEAIDLLPADTLARLVSRYMDVKQLLSDAPKRTLLDEVRAFDADSRAGKYYESFLVSSSTSMEKSTGTRAFIADCNRLLDRCVAGTTNGDATEVLEAIELILGLVRYIDECHDDVVFFADEGGAWQVAVDWARVFPAWFACLSRTSAPDEYARRVVAVVDEFDMHDRKKHLSAALQLGAASQRKALRIATTEVPGEGGGEGSATA